MTRELKFRAWDKKTNKMYPIDSLVWDLSDNIEEVWLSGVELEYIDPETSPGFRTMDEVFLEQYTGIKDRNGKEIYEGDIVRVARSYGYGFLPKGAIAIIDFDEKELCYKLRCQGEFRLTAKKELEVIGNIHEKDCWKEIRNESI